MKALRIILFTILSIFAAVYFAFLFVLPYAVDLNQYSPQITQGIEKATGFQVEIHGLKVKTAWNLSGGALIDKADLKYPKNLSGGKKFAQINGLEVKLSLLPLMLGQIKVDSVDADKAIVNVELGKHGQWVAERKNAETLNPLTPALSRGGRGKSAGNPSPLQPFTYSPSMPDVNIKKYKINFIEVATGKDYAIKGTDFKVSDFVLGKKIKVKTVGDLILNKKKQISYNIAIFSKVLPDFGTKPPAKQQLELNILTIFEDLVKYNLCANINTDLKITGKSEAPQEALAIDGRVDLDNVKFTLKGTTLPSSDLKLKFDGDKIKIKSNFYTAMDEKALITGVFDNGRKKAINVKVLSDRTDIGNSLLIANTLLELVGRNDLKDIKANGHLNANFNVKSDFKKIQSSGFLKIDNASLFHKLYNVSLKEICADIDFSENKIDIKKSSAKLDGEPISIKGFIDRNAKADISIVAGNLSLKGLLTTLGQGSILKENDILSGLIDINASIKGRLDKAIPTVDILASNVSLRNKPNKALTKFSSAQIKMVSSGKKTKGKMEIVGLKLFMHAPVKVFSVPKMKINFNEKDLSIDNATLFLNNSKIDIFGKVSDYSTDKFNPDITARGLILSKEIKSMLPRQNQVGVAAVGKIPLLVRITGRDKQEIHAQMLANPTNHLALFDVDTLKGKTSIINAQLTLAGNELKINEITLYSLKQNKGLSSNMKANLDTGSAVVTVGGKVFNLNNQNPQFSDVKINIPTQITTAIPAYFGSVVKIKGDLNLSGAMNKPEIRGYLTIPLVFIPTAKINMKNLVLTFNKNYINASCPQLNISKSAMGFNAIVPNDFSKGLLIKDIDYTATYLDLDSLSAALANLPQSVNGPGVDLGVTILNGKGTINKFKTGGITATNVTSDLSLKKNVLKLRNVKGDSFFGKIGGIITYDFIYGHIGLNLQGRGLSAGPAIKGLMGLSDSIVGQLDFDTNVSMTGYTPNQLLSSMKGDTEFILYNGKMGRLGKLEHLLYAQNVISNNVFRTSLNVVAKALLVKNTGLYKYIKGKVTFSHGWANISSIKTSGPSMSMYIAGRYNLLDNSANLTILGRLSDDVVRVLGPLGDLSMDKVFSYIPKVGAITSLLINQMTTNPEGEDTSMIPSLTPKTQLPTKNFKVVIDGDINRQSSVKSFKWLSSPQLPQFSQAAPPNYPSTPFARVQAVQERVKVIRQEVSPATQTPRYNVPKGIPDFINALPDLK